MAELYRKSNSPFWWYDFSVQGKRFRGSTKRKLKREAKQVADQLEKEQLNLTQTGSSTKELTLREALSLYVHKHRHGRKRYAEWRAGHLLDWLPGDLPFHKLTTAHLRDFVDQRLDHGSKPRTINADLNVISVVKNIAAEDYRVPANLKIPRMSVTHIPRPLSDSEVDRLLELLDPARPMRGKSMPTKTLGTESIYVIQRRQNHDMVIGLLNTGCRFGELAALRWDQVAPDFSKITFFRHKTKSSAGGRAFQATMTCSKSMREMLERRYQKRGSTKHVFPAWKQIERGTMIWDDVPMRSTSAIRAAINQAGINSPENVAIYGRRDVRSLRDTFATRMIRAGLPIEQVSKLLGHTNLQQTMKYASFDVQAVTDRAAAALDALEG